MGHLEIAYDLLVIMIAEGAALSIVVFWAVRTGESAEVYRKIKKN